ncbi:MAG: hypothetical protein GKR88_18120 [Flavobacteriaceae bacterium]|nr:MAG: hypothetical protein GKR88_18120 [Flavobacteriaceae bacterium]
MFPYIGVRETSYKSFAAGAYAIKVENSKKFILPTRMIENFNVDTLKYWRDLPISQIAYNIKMNTEFSGEKLYKKLHNDLKTLTDTQKRAVSHVLEILKSKGRPIEWEEF